MIGRNAENGPARKGVAIIARTGCAQAAEQLGEASMSSTFGHEEAQAYIHKLLKVMHQTGGSDLFISADFPPSIKSQGAMKPLSQQ
eukprot:gene23385-43888_t